MTVSVTTLLDASKSGHRLRPGILEKDLRAYGFSALKIQTPRGSESLLDILTQLKKAGQETGDELLKQHRDAGTDLDQPQRPDKDLAAPYEAASKHANKVFSVTKSKAFTDELELIRRHVDLAKDMFIAAACKKNQSPLSQSKKGTRTKSDQEDVMAKATREYAKPIENVLLIRDVEEVKASYAYLCNIKFAFTVAFNQLCLIKARASSEGIAPSLRIFDEGKSFNPSFLRALSLSRYEEDESDLFQSRD